MNRINCEYSEKSGCGAVYNFYNCNCCNNENKNSYSTEETICGTWIDGKPLYRKVIVGETAKQEANDIVFADIASLEIEQLTRLDGHFISKSGSTIHPSIAYTSQAGDISGVFFLYYNSEREIVYHIKNTAFTSCTLYITIEYTKNN